MSLFSPKAKQHLRLRVLTIDRCPSLSPEAMFSAAGVVGCCSRMPDVCKPSVLEETARQTSYQEIGKRPLSDASSRKDNLSTVWSNSREAIASDVSYLRRLSAVGITSVSQATWEGIRGCRPDLELILDPAEYFPSKVGSCSHSCPESNYFAWSSESIRPSTSGVQVEGNGMYCHHKDVWEEGTSLVAVCQKIAPCSTVPSSMCIRCCCLTRRRPCDSGPEPA